MIANRIHPAFWFWLLPILFLAACDTADSLEEPSEPDFSLRLHQIVEGDTMLAGTFSLASDQAFDLSRTAQKRYPTASTILGTGLQGPFAFDSVSRGSLFLLTTTQTFPPSL